MTPTIQQSLLTAQQHLTPFTDQPLLESEILLAHVLKKTRAFLYAWPEFLLSSDQFQLFTHYIQRRCKQEPIAYIIQAWEFWSLSLNISTATLIPRPETEILVQSILKLDQGDLPKKIADLGTGSGAIGLALASERHAWEVYATDICTSALQVARSNAHQLAFENISFYQGHWCAALPCLDFDVIASNPPYLSETEWPFYAQGLNFEPRKALISGQDGLNAMREITESAQFYLKPYGYLLVEHGFSQAPAVRALFANKKYKNVFTVNDLAGHPRVTIGQYLP